jgi:murein DD-endopeptidase MepM/ murein hydrolase activator NlpD
LVTLKRSYVAMLCGFGLALGASAPAVAASSASVPAPASSEAAPAPASSGGAFPSEQPVITGLACAARCASIDAAQPGSTLRVRGTAMRDVRKVVFLGVRGASDDVAAQTLRARVKSVDVLVPEKARSGPLMAVNKDGAQSLASRTAVSIQAARSGAAALDLRVVGRRVFVAAARPARIDLLAHQPLNVVVALARLSDGAVVQSWPLGPLVPGVVRSVTWDGTVTGVAQPMGRYEFRVFSQPTGVQAAQAPEALATGAFDLVDHKFPIRGKHTYGTGIAAFGAARNGHTHQGQDVFANCGTPLVAARGGVVKLNQNEANAGNYLVIDGVDTDVDYVYMHLRDRSPLKKGAPVKTGQLIGAVGDTGDATACHLHFEMWNAPGWYTGGQPFDPLAALKVWDAYS